MKAFNILHLEHVANRIDQLLNPTQREQFTQVRQIKPGIKFVINNKLTPYKHRQSVFEQIQSSRSSIIQTQDRQRKSNNSSSKSSSFWKNKLIKKNWVICKKLDYLKNKPIHSVHKMALYNNLQEIQQDHKLLIIDKKPQSARKLSINHQKNQMGLLKETIITYVFIEFSYRKLLKSTRTVCYMHSQSRNQSKDQSNSFAIKKCQLRFDNLIKRPIKIWNNDLIEFKGWDVEEEDDYLRLG